MVEKLAAQVDGSVLVPADAEYAEEVAAFNTAITHRPDVVVGAASVSDVVAAVGYARDHGLRVTVQATGHGAHAPVTSGLMVTTRRLDEVGVAGRTVTAGAGTRWGQLFEATAGTGLFPVAGSSPTVGVVGYLLGGGLGPLARSHGFSSDYIEQLTLVTGTAEVKDVTADSDPELFWALLGGKGGFGVVTSVRLRLVDLPNLYAGSLFFAEEHIEAALRMWVDWTATADPAVSTSVAIIRFPPIAAVPEPFRGHRLLSLRFAYPGPTGAGIKLADPLRAAAPVYVDALGELPVSEFARIHNDPPEPGPSFVRGMLLTHVDQDFASALLAEVGAGTDAPFVAAEIRHLGGATRRDIPGGSAVSGRTAGYTFGVVGVNPALFESELPAAADRLSAAVQPWVAAEKNINFVGQPGDLAGAWPAQTWERLVEVRRRVDPEGLFQYG